MAIKITDDCINCGACEPECPNNAIYKNGEEWSYSDGTSLNGEICFPNGESVNADNRNAPLSNEYFFIVPNKCTECVGFHDQPQCASVCPVDCCVKDEKNEESEDLLLSKKELLHS